jgi:DNA/RNA-binding domain of Phe-tRNA-synthetase-like protein
MLLIQETGEWRTAHPGAVIGLLELSNVVNTTSPLEFYQRKRAVEEELRRRYGGLRREDLNAVPVMAAYKSYYKRFKKTYHVLLQIESVVLKGKSLPGVSPLVDANFMAELETLVLTAGHDVGRLYRPVTIDVSREGDSITQMNGEVARIYPGDMIMRDAKGVSCSIIYGQDHRSPISPGTTHALFVSYAPPGVPAESVDTQLRKVSEYVSLFSPEALTEQLRLIHAEESE